MNAKFVLFSKKIDFSVLHGKRVLANLSQTIIDYIATFYH